MLLAESQVLAPVLSAVMLTVGMCQQSRPGTLGNVMTKSFGGRLTRKYVILRAFFYTKNASRNVLLVALKLHKLFLPCLVQLVGQAELNFLGVRRQLQSYLGAKGTPGDCLIQPLLCAGQNSKPEKL